MSRVVNGVDPRTRKMDTGAKNVEVLTYMYSRAIQQINHAFEPSIITILISIPKVEPSLIKVERYLKGHSSCH
jgi:hypothetical protein